MSGELAREMKRADNEAHSELQALIQKFGLGALQRAFDRIQRTTEIVGRLKS